MLKRCGEEEREGVCTCVCVFTCVCVCVHTCVHAREVGSTHGCAPRAAERVPRRQPRIKPSLPARPWQPRQLCPCFAQPVFQPEELIFYLSAFAMLIEDAPRSKTCWRCRGVQPRPGALGGWGVHGCASCGVTANAEGHVPPGSPPLQSSGLGCGAANTPSAPAPLWFCFWLSLK